MLTPCHQLLPDLGLLSGDILRFISKSMPSPVLLRVRSGRAGPPTTGRPDLSVVQAPTSFHTDAKCGSSPRKAVPVRHRRQEASRAAIFPPPLADLGTYSTYDAPPDSQRLDRPHTGYLPFPEPAYLLPATCRSAKTRRTAAAIKPHRTMSLLMPRVHEICMRQFGKMDAENPIFVLKGGTMLFAVDSAVRQCHGPFTRQCRKGENSHADNSYISHGFTHDVISISY